MKNKYKKNLIIIFILLILVLLLSFVSAYFVNINTQNLFLVNGFAFKNYSSININLGYENKITSNKSINFEEVGINFYANANYKYELNGVPCNFNEIYDLTSFEKGEGKNINSSFIIERNNDYIYFTKDKTLKEIISFYKGDVEFVNPYSTNVDYYRCELTYGGEVVSFTFGEEISGINIDNAEVIF